MSHNHAQSSPRLPGILSAQVVPCDLLMSCFGLRHAYFVREKGWVKDNSIWSGAEIDHYDSCSLHLSVCEREKVLAYVRVLPHQPEVGFMLDSDFASLLSEEHRRQLSREGAVELSRLVCRSDYIRSEDCQGFHPVELLLKLLYQESKVRGFHIFYIVVEEAWLRPFSRRFGLPFRVIGKPYTFPDGTRTVAAVATLEELEEGMKRHSAAKYEWYKSQDEP